MCVCVCVYHATVGVPAPPENTHSQQRGTNPSFSMLIMSVGQRASHHDNQHTSLHNPTLQKYILLQLLQELLTKVDNVKDFHGLIVGHSTQ